VSEKIIDRPELDSLGRLVNTSLAGQTVMKRVQVPAEASTKRLLQTSLIEKMNLNG
jgi:hypothetical protein